MTLNSLELTSEIIPKMPTYLETITKYHNPGELNNTANLFQFAHDTNLKYFEWLQERPESRTHFEKVMGDGNAWFHLIEPKGLAALYPYEQELGHDTGDDDVVLVDVGGGRGQILVDVHKFLPNLKGRLVLEDLPPTFINFKAPPGIELVPCSFFDPQPIIGTCSLIMAVQELLRLCRSTCLHLPSCHA